MDYRLSMRPSSPGQPSTMPFWTKSPRQAVSQLQYMLEGMEISTSEPEPIAAPGSTIPKSQPLINRLPTETLVLILSFVQHGLLDFERATHLGKELRSWSRTFNVCRSWRATVCGAPLFWQDIFVGKSTRFELFELYLHRAASAPLHIEFCRTRNLVPFLKELSNRLLSISRLTFDFLDRGQARVVSEFLQHDFPSLTQLRITIGLEFKEQYYQYDSSWLESAPPIGNDMRYVYSHREIFSLVPRRDQFPAIQRLWLRNVALANPLAIEPSLLTSLSLQRALGGSSVTLDDFCRFLGGCTNLRNLLLDNHCFRVVHSDGQESAGYSPPSPVTLSASLRWIHLRDTTSYISEFLSRFCIPATTHMFLTQSSSTNSMHSKRTQRDPLDIDLDIGRCFGRYRHPEREDYPYTSFAIRYDTLYSTPDRIRSIVLDFSGSPIVELVITNIPRNEMGVSDWTALLAHLPLLRRLSFPIVLTLEAGGPPAVECSHPTVTFLSALACAQPNGHPLCPDLEDLTIAMHDTEDYHDGDILQRALAACLEARAALRAQHIFRLRIVLKDLHGCPAYAHAVRGVHEERKRRLRRVLGRFVDKIRYDYRRDWDLPGWLPLVGF
ncbi:hypothetical protein BN946_scf185000.g39 [Trametes cinnabarina]|uniref:Uncharacterized protein n=1 Tax=Pycnoporus cinnabarinus TaxID=5643 RepID=A0A060S410_PYCCI|nr:hypothetical protein BN946_scf185000.g39 [Trametes cinnabarina]